MSHQKENESDVFIVGISGSLRQGSYTLKTVKIALEGAEEVGAKTEVINLRDFSLAFCDGRPNNDYPNDVLRLRKIVKKAKGLILGTPEYHGSYSGVLKNALDLMGFDEIEGKMVGLVGVSGGVLGAANALASLRTVGRALHAWLIPEQCSIPQAWKEFDDNGNLKNADLENRVKEVGRQVARFAFLHTSEKAQEFLRAWEGAPMNPGG